MIVFAAVVAGSRPDIYNWTSYSSISIKTPHRMGLHLGIVLIEHSILKLLKRTVLSSERMVLASLRNLACCHTNIPSRCLNKLQK